MTGRFLVTKEVVGLPNNMLLYCLAWPLQMVAALLYRLDEMV
jgi:hypothetical protein